MAAMKKYDWKQRFIGALKMRPIIAEATDIAGVARATIYRARSEDDEFRHEMDIAIEEGLDRVESKLYESDDVKALIYILNTRRYKREENNAYDAMLEARDSEIKMVWESGDRESLPD